MNRRAFVSYLGGIAGVTWALPAQSANWWERLTGRDGDKASPGAEGLTDIEISSGLKDALRVGAENAIRLLSVEDGFFGNPEIRIPLPNQLEAVRSTLDRFGLGQQFDELELELNRAAELATPQAQALFMDAIGSLTLEDVQGIYGGGDDAATRYLQDKTSTPLAAKMTPIVADSLSKVGAAKTYAAVMTRYNEIPFAPKIDADLTSYVVDRGLSGLFHTLAKEEAAIRKDPVKQTTAILRKVFS